jgi:hypothetical protein
MYAYTIYKLVSKVKNMLSSTGKLFSLAYNLRPTSYIQLYNSVVHSPLPPDQSPLTNRSNIRDFSLDSMHQNTCQSIQVFLKNIIHGSTFIMTDCPIHIVVTGHESPHGCETLRLPHFLDNMPTDGIKVVSLTHKPPFIPQEDSWYSFLLEAESTPGPQCGWKD